MRKEYGEMFDSKSFNGFARDVDCFHSMLLTFVPLLDRLGLLLSRVSAWQQF